VLIGDSSSCLKNRLNGGFLSGDASRENSQCDAACRQ